MAGLSGSAEALANLKQHYKLVILSNVDHTGFAGSNARLGVTFDAIYTAQEIGSYKPDLANFHHMLAHLSELSIGKSDILYIAQSLFHDHAPAKADGIASAWIDRRHATCGFGATMAPRAWPTTCASPACPNMPRLIAQNLPRAETQRRSQRSSIS